MKNELSDYLTILEGQGSEKIPKVGLTVTQAAKVTGISESTIRNYLENGKLSFYKSETGVVLIDPIELKGTANDIKNGVPPVGKAGRPEKKTEKK